MVLPLVYSKKLSYQINNLVDYLNESISTFFEEAAFELYSYSSITCWKLVTVNMLLECTIAMLYNYD